MVRRVIHQHDFQIVAIGKLDQPFHELRAMTRTLGTIVQVDDQLPNVSVTIFVLVPPLLKTVDDKITRVP